MIIVGIDRINLDLISASFNFNFGIEVAGIIGVGGVVFGGSSNNDGTFGITRSFDGHF